MKKIAIICGGPSHEHEVSINSTKSILKNINRKLYDPTVFYISKVLKCQIFKPTTDNWKLNPKEPFLSALQKLKKFDLAFLGMHGEFGEDGVIQTFLDFEGVKYTGCDPYASKLCMDKYRTALIIKQLGVLIPKTKLIRLEDAVSLTKFPFVLKPNKAGSSVGTGIIKNAQELKNFLKSIKKDFDPKSEYLVQELISGTELSCGCLQDKNGKFIKLPPIEIIPQVSSFFSYKAKYAHGGSKEISPPQSISKALSNKISNLACEIHELLGCKTYSRSDFFVKNDKIYYLETNTLPGMTETSLLPQEAAAAGINFSELLDFLIKASI